MNNKHLIQRISKEEFNILHNQKECLPDNYFQEDIELPIDCIKKSSKRSVQLLRNGKAYNNIRLIMPIKYDNADDINVDDILQAVEFKSGTKVIDIINGKNLTMLLKMQNLSCTIANGMIIIPLPFDITSENNLFICALSQYYEQRINIEFGNKYDIGPDGGLLITYYSYNDHISPEPKNIFVQNPPYNSSITNNIPLHAIDHVQLFSFSDSYFHPHVMQIYESARYRTNYLIGWKHPIESLIFSFFDENKNIIKDCQFDKVSLVINGHDVIFESRISVLDKTIKKFGSFDGFYYMSLENLNTKFNNANPERYTNFALVNNAKLCFNGNIPIKSAQFISITAIMYNINIYSSGMPHTMY